MAVATYIWFLLQQTENNTEQGRIQDFRNGGCLRLKLKLINNS